MTEAKRRRQAMAAYTLRRFLEEPKRERENRILEVCSRCRYAYGYRTNKVFHMRWCNWDAFHGGKIRPCAGRDCVAMGYFDPVEKKNRESVMRLLNKKTYAERVRKEGEKSYEDD